MLLLLFSCCDGHPVRNKGECVKAGDPESCSIKRSELHPSDLTVGPCVQGGRTSAAPEFTGVAESSLWRLKCELRSA